MPKTVFSKRNQLSRVELKRYGQNLQKLKTIKKELANSVELDYVRIFTEAQAGGGCRMKFWGISDDSAREAINWLKQNHPEVEIEFIPRSKMGYPGLPGLSMKVK